MNIPTKNDTSNCSIEKMAEQLKKYKEICIVYHIRPDGDCIGSAYALCLALQSVGIKCSVEGTDEVPHRQRYLTDKVSLDTLTEPVFLAIDSASPDRTGIYENTRFTFCIDHHRDNSIQADYKYVEEDCGACAEIILKLIKTMGVTVTKDIADLLYTGLVCDTMCFRTKDTDIQSFETAAELAGYGADIYYIGRHNMFYKSKQRLKIEEILRNSFHFIENDKIATGIITLDDLKEADILDSELEGINSLIDEMEEVLIGVTIRELPDGRTRCSMRSKGDIAANEICKLFGGSGHYNAACCVLDMNVEEARNVIENACKDYIK